MEKPNVGAAVVAALAAGIAVHTPEIPRMPAAVIASKRHDDEAALRPDHGPHYEHPQLEARPPAPLTARELMSARRPIYRWWEQEDEDAGFAQSVIARQRSNALLTILSQPRAG